MGFQDRITRNYRIGNIEVFKKKAWNWCDNFEISCILENNSIEYPYGPFLNVVAVGQKETISRNEEDSFERLKLFHSNHRDWCFGYFSYDLKNEIEELASNNPDFINAKEFLFFIPETIVFFQKDSITISSFSDPDIAFKQIQEGWGEMLESTDQETLVLSSVSKEKYLETVEQLKQHIIEGDIYEINYCIEYKASVKSINPISTFWNLTRLSPMPFSFFLRTNDIYVIGASPERFLKKEGKKLISQPIKGTIRGRDHEEDQRLVNKLKTSEKELAENLMIVDIARNDLAKSSVPGSVSVEEIFGVYSFQQLHQMISTVTAEKRGEVHYVDAIKNAFPMASMTGAPKIRAMELIENFESAKRGIFSGAGGYFTPDGDFDFNVLIRSIFYNSSSGNLSFQVGSAITFDADPESEYSECQLKAKVIFEILGGKQN